MIIVVYYNKYYIINKLKIRNEKNNIYLDIYIFNKYLYFYYFFHIFSKHSGIILFLLLLLLFFLISNSWIFLIISELFSPNLENFLYMCKFYIFLNFLHYIFYINIIHIKIFLMDENYYFFIIIYIFLNHSF